MFISAGVVRGHKNPLFFGLPLRLQEARQAAGLTRVAIEGAAGVSNGTVSHIENSEPGVAPGVDTVERIARALGVDPCALAYGPEGPLRFQQKRPRGEDPPPSPPLAPGPDEPPRHRELPARLKRARDAAGLSRKALAKAAGLSLTAISNIEEGRSLPSVESAERLSVSLDVSPGWLAYGTGEGLAPPDGTPPSEQLYS